MQTINIYFKEVDKKEKKREKMTYDEWYVIENIKRNKKKIQWKKIYKNMNIIIILIFYIVTLLIINIKLL